MSCFFASIPRCSMYRIFTYMWVILWGQCWLIYFSTMEHLAIISYYIHLCTSTIVIGGINHNLASKSTEIWIYCCVYCGWGLVEFWISIKQLHLHRMGALPPQCEERWGFHPSLGKSYIYIYIYIPEDLGI